MTVSIMWDFDFIRQLRWAHAACALSSVLTVGSVWIRNREHTERTDTLTTGPTGFKTEM